MYNIVILKQDLDWDLYFMRIAEVVATRSKCLSRQIGAVLVRDNRIISTGYNGPASRIKHCDYRDDSGNYTNKFQSSVCPRKRMGFKSGDGMEYCPAVHAEANAIVQAAKIGVSTQNSTLYCFCGIPCTDCAKEIINAGVVKVVCTQLKESRPWALLASEMFLMAGVVIQALVQQEDGSYLYEGLDLPFKDVMLG